MKWKFWNSAEPETVLEEVAPPEPETASNAEPEPVYASAPEVEPEPEPESASQLEREPDTAPAQVTLTIDEAKDAIREAGGDVIQVGFLASAYRRHHDEDPGSSDTAASRKKLRELVGQRLKDRGLLAADGTLELRD